MYESDRPDESLRHFDQAIAYKPGFPEAHCNRGVALLQLNRLDEALESLDRAIQLDPKLAGAHWNKSLLLLLTGDYTQGFREHEWRWLNDQIPVFKEKREFRKPLWLGNEPLPGKTILLHAEQGFGDTIQFSRYARLVTALGAKVILEVPAALEKLMHTLHCTSSIIVKGEPLPDFDFHCPLMSLPLAFGTTLESIPFSEGYLTASEAAIAQWNKKLGGKMPPRIGLAWSGNPMHKNDRNRSVQLAELAEHLPREFDYVCLQKNLSDSDLEYLESSRSIRNFGDALVDYSDTAALCEHMDLVISVDTSIAHLAGALGKKVWVLLPHRPDWRWLLNRRTSPWYQSAALYRQQRRADWSNVFAEMKRDLLHLFGSTT